MTDRELEDIRTELLGIANRLLNLSKPEDEKPDVTLSTTNPIRWHKEAADYGTLTQTRLPDEAVLEDRGWRRMRGEYVPPLVVETDVEAHDDLEGLFDRLREETDGD